MATPRKGAPVERICSSIAVLNAIGVKEPSQREVARIADYPGHRSESFQNAVKVSEKLGFIHCRPRNQHLRLSATGRNCVLVVSPPRDKAELLSRLRMVLGKKRAPKASFIILEILSDGKVHTLQSLAEAIDGRPNHHKTAGFKSAVSAIGVLKVLDRPVKGVDGSIVLKKVQGR